MSNLRNKVRKAILPKCEGCRGKGLKQDYVPYIKPTIKSGTTGALNNIKPIIYCKTCNGKGYVEELEPNECGHCGFSVECDTCEKSIKPNDLTLQEVLLALGKNSDPNWYIEFMTNDSIQIRGGIRLTLPLTLPPEQWDKELQDKIIELLN